MAAAPPTPSRLILIGDLHGQLAKTEQARTHAHTPRVHAHAP
jgi:hypothetical protein